MENNFPEEIILEIFMKLAVKSLVRFTCVNKEWCSIISNPRFASAHFAHTNRSHDNNTDRRILLLADSSEVTTTVFPCLGKPAVSWESFTTVVPCLIPCLGKQVIEEQDHSIKSFNEHKQLKASSRKNYDHFEVVGSCNGLVLIKHYIDTVTLWNPLLEKSVNIPKPDNIGYDERQVYSTDYCSTSWGLGFDSQKNDYKVVKIVFLKNNGGAKFDSVVQIFSLATGDWKSFRVGAPTCSLRHQSHNPQPFISGAIHWLASAMIGYGGNRHLVLSFDISNEIFRDIMLPEQIAYREITHLSSHVYGKSLAICCSSSHSFQLWVMKEYGEVESWTQVLIKPKIPRPLGFTTGGEVVWNTESGIALYDPKKPKIMNHSVKRKRRRYFFAGSYVESLVLLDPRKRGRGIEEERSKRE